MPLFQRTVIKKHLLELNNTEIDAAYKRFTDYFHNSTIQKNIREAKEEQFQEGFLRELFGHIMGYTLNPNPNFNLTTELKNTTNSKKADGAILIDGKAIAVIELKGTETTDLNKIEVQAFGYKNNQSECTYVVTSNFEKLRFYIDNTIDFEEFNLFTLNRDQFNLLYLCLSYENIKNNVPKRLKAESVSQEDQITKKLYKDYSEFKRALFNNLVELNTQYDKLLLFKKTQKLLDRFLFIFFAEDRLLLPTNLIFRINQEWKNLQAMRIPVSLYERYMVYFNDLNHGAKVTLPAFGKKTGEAITAEFEIFAYNGGLFLPDDVLDNVKIDDVVLHTYSEKLSHYDFDSDVDVNILGHIFENSLNEIDEIKSEIEGEVIDRTKTRRKKDGVFYTPKYITKYIVDNTVGKLCEEKKAELKLKDEDYINDKKLQTKTKKALLDKLSDYRNWLLDLTICDPACGSGAFLNQALEFLIAEHRYIDELQAKLMGDAMILSDVETSILENNIYGVDLNDESVEIAKLSLWLRTAQKGRKLNSLNNNIKCGNSLIDDPQVAGEKAFSWGKEFSEVFAVGGFDVVIGNPPYVQLQTMKEFSMFIKEKDFKSFENTGDLYCLFYEQGNKILKSNGLLGFITSNKWMKANYGKSLRNYLIENTNPYLLIDLGAGIFESAVVDSNILFFKKEIVNENNIITAIDLKNEKNVFDFTVFGNNTLEITLTKDTIWLLSNKSQLNFKEKIEKLGKPLKEWGINLYRGVQTGNNDIFIINQFQKEQLILENKNAQKLIFPLLQGKNLSRYNADFKNQYLIYTNADTNLEDYPSIEKYLLQYKSQLDSKIEVKQGKMVWYSLYRPATNHFNEFFKDKIIFSKASKEQSFFYDNKLRAIALNTSYIATGKDIKSLVAILNSKFIRYCFLNFYQSGGINGEITIQAIERIPIPILDHSKKEIFEDYVVNLSFDFEKLSQLKINFFNYISSNISTEYLSDKLEKWYDLEFVDFIKELNKAINRIKGTPLTKKDEFEWMELFEGNKKKVLELKAEIDKTDKEIDQLVYALYGLTEEEIKIVEGV